MNDVLRGFRCILVFSGRDSREAFWPYAVIIFVLTMAVGMAVFMPSLSESMVRMQQFAAAHPDQAVVTQGPGSYSISIRGSHPELFPDFGMATHRMGAVIGVGALLLAAAVTRRLHDRGFRGLLGLLPLPFLGFSLVEMPKIFAFTGDSQTLPPGFFTAFASNFLYIGALGLLGFLLVGPSQNGPNRYGDAPPQPPPRPPPPPLTPRRPH